MVEQLMVVAVGEVDGDYVPVVLDRGEFVGFCAVNKDYHRYLMEYLMKEVRK